MFGLKFARQTSGKQVNKAYRPVTYILREKNVWYDMAIWTQNVYYTKYEMSITPALILLCRINITKFPQAQYFDDKQKLFVKSSVNLNC